MTDEYLNRGLLGRFVIFLRDDWQKRDRFVMSSD